MELNDFLVRDVFTNCLQQLYTVVQNRTNCLHLLVNTLHNFLAYATCLRMGEEKKFFLSSQRVTTITRMTSAGLTKNEHEIAIDFFLADTTASVRPSVPRSQIPFIFFNNFFCSPFNIDRATYLSFAT